MDSVHPAIPDCKSQVMEVVQNLRLKKETPTVRHLTLMEYVLNVLKELSLILSESVSQLILHVWTMIELVDSVHHAMLAMKYLQVEVAFHLKLLKEILTVKLSTTIFVLSAQKEPYSILKESVLLLTLHV